VTHWPLVGSPVLRGPQSSTKQVPIATRGVCGVVAKFGDGAAAPSAGALFKAPWPVAKIEMTLPRAAGLVVLFTE